MRKQPIQYIKNKRVSAGLLTETFFVYFQSLTDLFHNRFFHYPAR